MGIQKAVILCRPETSANIGAVCRVMANTGLSDLRITGHKEDYDENEIFKLALHSKYIWETARFFPPTAAGLKAASADCSALAGTTRRTGRKRTHTSVSPEELCVNLLRFAGPNGRLGLAFGNERTGLTEEESECCSFSVTIPASADFGSYNLSHAVLIIAYSLFTAEETAVTQTKGGQNGEPCGGKRAPLALIRHNSEEICRYLSRLGMFKTGGRHENEAFFANLLSGAGEFEANHLLEIFKKVFYIKTEPQCPAKSEKAAAGES